MPDLFCGKTEAADRREPAHIPMVGRSTFWTVLIDTNTAEVIAFVPLDSF